MKFTWKKFPGYPLSHRPFFGNSFRDLSIWVKVAKFGPFTYYFSSSYLGFGVGDTDVSVTGWNGGERVRF